MVATAGITRRARGRRRRAGPSRRDGRGASPPAAGAAAEAGREPAVLEHPADRVAHGVGLDRHDQRVALRRDQLTNPREIRYHHRATACHRLPDRPGSCRRRGSTRRRRPPGSTTPSARRARGRRRARARAAGCSRSAVPSPMCLSTSCASGSAPASRSKAARIVSGVVDRRQRAQAEDHRPGPETEQLPQRRAGAVRRRERREVDAPVDEQGRSGRAPSSTRRSTSACESAIATPARRSAIRLANVRIRSARSTSEPHAIATSGDAPASAAYAA